MTSWNEVNQHINRALADYIACAEATRLAHEQAVIAEQKAEEAEALARECREAMARFGRKRLLFEGRP